jgi:hypothetical protein
VVGKDVGLGKVVGLDRLKKYIEEERKAGKLDINGETNVNRQLEDRTKIYLYYSETDLKLALRNSALNANKIIDDVNVVKSKGGLNIVTMAEVRGSDSEGSYYSEVEGQSGEAETLRLRLRPSKRQKTNIFRVVLQIRYRVGTQKERLTVRKVISETTSSEHNMLASGTTDLGQRLRELANQMLIEGIPPELSQSTGYSPMLHAHSEMQAAVEWDDQRAEADVRDLIQSLIGPVPPHATTPAATISNNNNAPRAQASDSPPPTSPSPQRVVIVETKIKAHSSPNTVCTNLCRLAIGLLEERLRKAIELVKATKLPGVEFSKKHRVILLVTAETVFQPGSVQILDEFVARPPQSKVWATLPEGIYEPIVGLKRKRANSAPPPL